MKKLIRVCLLSALLIMALCITAFAAEPTITDATSVKTGVSITADGSTATVTYTGAESGKYYMIFVLTDENGVVTSENTVYINQETASGSTVTFTVNSALIEGGKTYYVFLSSSAEDIGAITKVATFKTEGGGPAVIRGDVDGSGELDEDDAIYVLFNYMFGDEEYPMNQTADFDGSGEVDEDDAIWLLFNYMFGDEDYPLAAAR